MSRYKGSVRFSDVAPYLPLYHRSVVLLRFVVVDGSVDQTSVHCHRGSVVFGCYSDLVRPTVNVNTKDASSGATACVCLSVAPLRWLRWLSRWCRHAAVARTTTRHARLADGHKFQVGRPAAVAAARCEHASLVCLGVTAAMLSERLRRQLRTYDQQRLWRRWPVGNGRAAASRAVRALPWLTTDGVYGWALSHARAW